VEKIDQIHTVSMVISLILVSLVGIYTGSKVTSAIDFIVSGRKAGVLLVTGTITGTLLGGASTVGTAELAFRYGFSAWWFTLGGGLGCFLLALILSRPLRQPGLETLPQLLTQSYGPAAGPVAGVFSATGMFFNIVAQVLAAIALIIPVFHLTPHIAALVAIVLIICYVSFGGAMSTGIVGTVKMIVLMLALILTGSLAYQNMGGFTGLGDAFPTYPWFSLFGRGYATDIAAGFALVVGVLSTQTYFQAMFSGRNIQTSVIGAMMAGIIMIPCGFAGILVGMSMRYHFPDIVAAEALPLFIINYLPAWLGGILLAVLLLAVVGTAAGLSLGISTMFTRDIYCVYVNKGADDKRILLVSRILLIGVVSLTMLFVAGNLKTMILQWSFLSMGLRGACVFLPLLGAIYFRKLVSPIGGVLALAIGPIAVLVWKVVFPQGIDPLYAGMSASFIVLFISSMIALVYRTAKSS